MAKRQAKKETVPKPSLEHLKRLTDDTGLFQHAKFTTPLRSEGYTTDDNARALIVTTKHYALYREPETLQLIDRYLAFVLHAHNDNGTVRNFMNFDRTWLGWPKANRAVEHLNSRAGENAKLRSPAQLSTFKQQEPVQDALGRVIWAFGELLAHPPSEIYVPIARERIDIAMPLIEKQYPRGMAYSILGLAGYLKQFPDAENAKSCMATAADSIVSRFEENGKPGWPWFEDILTYDNAMLPCALFTATMALSEKKYLKVAQKTCDFLLANTFTGDNFSFVGCTGWFPRGEPKAQFDQQPIEAAGTILMLNAAYQATGDKKFLRLRQKAFGWFMGENDLGIPLYDKATKGCSDGLGAEGVSANEGAESTLSFLLSLLIMR
jgi:hypothetical protein